MRRRITGRNCTAYAPRQPIYWTATGLATGLAHADLISRFVTCWTAAGRSTGPAQSVEPRKPSGTPPQFGLLRPMAVKVRKPSAAVTAFVLLRISRARVPVTEGRGAVKTGEADGSKKQHEWGAVVPA